MSQEDFQKQCVGAHNEFRSCHGADELVLSDVLSLEAFNWAKKMAKNGKLEHSNSKHGENIAFRSETVVDGATITRMWYDEIDDYSWDLGASSNGKPIGHFTQVVWKGTEEAGFGFAIGEKGLYAVANYDPAGNYRDRYKDNVGKKTREPNVAKIQKAKKNRDTEKGSGTSNSGSESKMPKPGTTVETKTETYSENGERKKKTTTITTTVTETEGGGYKTTTGTKTKIESIPEGYDESQVTKGISKLKTKDSDSDSDSDDDESELSRSEKRKFREELVEEINSLRKKHGASRLKKSRSLQRAAQKHAHKMLRDKDLKLIGGRHGQSLSMMQPRPRGKDIASQWYGEKSGYKFDKPEFTKGAGNFTQIVWKGSTDIGVGVASDKKGETYIIALFDPPGNVGNQFSANVGKA